MQYFNDLYIINRFFLRYFICSPGVCGLGKKFEKSILSNGGRVLNIVSRSNNFGSAREECLTILNEIKWDHGFFRKDIGHSVINE